MCILYYLDDKLYIINYKYFFEKFIILIQLYYNILQIKINKNIQNNLKKLKYYNIYSKHLYKIKIMLWKLRKKKLKKKKLQKHKKNQKTKTKSLKKLKKVKLYSIFNVYTLHIL